MTDKELVLSIYPDAKVNYGWLQETSVAIVMENPSSKLLSERCWTEERAWEKAALYIKKDMLRKLES
jgi:hypothetical protein